MNNLTDAQMNFISDLEKMMSDFKNMNIPKHISHIEPIAVNAHFEMIKEKKNEMEKWATKNMIPVKYDSREINKYAMVAHDCLNELLKIFNKNTLFFAVTPIVKKHLPNGTKYCYFTQGKEEYFSDYVGDLLIVRLSTFILSVLEKSMAPRYDHNTGKVLYFPLTASKLEALKMIKEKYNFPTCL